MSETALLSDERLALAHLRAGSANPRRSGDRKKLEELKVSIRTHGLQQPLLVRPINDTTFEVVAGNRRLAVLTELAQADAQFSIVPCRVQRMTDDEARYLALVENLHREDMHVADIVASVAELIAAGHNLTQISAQLAWSTSTAHLYAKISQAPDWLQAFLRGVDVTQKTTDPTKAPDVTHYPGLQIKAVLELVKLYERLRKLDENAATTPRYRPQAESMTKRMAAKAAAGEWSQARMTAEIAALFEDESNADIKPEREKRGGALSVTKKAIHLDLAMLHQMSAADRATVAMELHRALTAIDANFFGGVGQ